MSLSVYNRPTSLATPKTAIVNILEGIKGLEAAGTDEYGIPVEVPSDPRIAEMQVPDGLQRLARTGTEQLRLEEMVEIQLVKDKLARDGCPMSMTTLQRAVTRPEEIEWLPGERKYPNPGESLMKNPFPKPKKKKKGKKKRK